MLLEKSCLKLILCFRLGVILRRLSALPLAYADHERWCFSDSWDHTAWRYIQGTRAKSLLLSSLPGVFTLGLTESICVQGNQMTLVYMEREYSSPEDPHVGIVHLVEVKNLVPKKKSLYKCTVVAIQVFSFSLQESFRHAQTGNSVSREELMMVLVELESLQIRALHSQSAQSVSLRAAVLEGADNLPSGRHASNVEICLCPGNYLGDSCQVVCFNKNKLFYAIKFLYYHLMPLYCRGSVWIWIHKPICLLIKAGIKNRCLKGYVSMLYCRSLNITGLNTKLLVTLYFKVLFSLLTNY